MSAKEAFNAPFAEFFAKSQDGMCENEIAAAHAVAAEKAYRGALECLGWDDTPANRMKVWMMGTAG